MQFEEVAFEIQIELAKNAIQNPEFETLPNDVQELLNKKSKLTSNSK